MGSSSGGSSSYSSPRAPVPPNVVPYGQTAAFQPNFVNFLGDPSVPSTGLTPGMLAQIDSGDYGVMNPPQQAQTGGADRGMLAEIMARLDAMQNQERQGYGQRGGMRRGIGGSSHGGGYTTSGREGAGGFGSRSSSASRAGGGLY